MADAAPPLPRLRRTDAAGLARSLARGYVALVTLTTGLIVLGALVRAHGAGLACPDFPTCLGSWVPPLFAGTVLAHFSHRMLGYLVLLTAAMLYLFVLRDTRQRRNRPLALSFLVLVAVQVAVGALVVLSGLHYLAAALHLAVALGMLSVLARLWVNTISAEGTTLSLPRS